MKCLQLDIHLAYQRTQWVVIKGHSSIYVHVDSGVPQGTVPDPLMFHQ